MAIRLDDFAARVAALPDVEPRLFLCIADVAAAFVLVYLMMLLTQRACFGSSLAERWAMFRRIIFALVAFCLFAKGVWRFERPQPVDWVEATTQFGIIGGVVIFPILRALDLVDQDHLTDRAG